MVRPDRLCEYFEWDDVSRSDTAVRLGIDNEPPDGVIPNILHTAKCMDDVRTYLDKPILVSSWFRCEALERAINWNVFTKRCVRNGVSADETQWRIYFARKAHPKGNAVDFKCPKFGSPEVVFNAIRQDSGIKFDQIILEFDSWIHLSFTQNPRGQMLIIDSKGERLA